MSRIFCSPTRYIQGAGALAETGTHAARFGSRALLLGGRTALELCGPAITASLTDKGIGCRRETFRGISSGQEVARLVQAAQGCGADLIIALGGGAAIDAGKAVAHELGCPVIVIPTTVATDAPCSALSVIYREDGVFDRYLPLLRNPECVLVDTAVIAAAPVRFLVAGMGDALACAWESDTCRRSDNPALFCGGSRPTEMALAAARRCYDILREQGPAARAAVEQGVVTPALEAVVEANTLLSGYSSENGGHAGAHSIHNGLTVLPESGNSLHGEKVAFSVLAQLVLEERTAREIREVQQFCTSVGLPVCLADLGISTPTEAAIRAVAETATAPGETIHATWFPVTPAMVINAIRAADTLGNTFKTAAGN